MESHQVHKGLHCLVQNPPAHDFPTHHTTFGSAHQLVLGAVCALVGVAIVGIPRIMKLRRFLNRGFNNCLVAFLIRDALFYFQTHQSVLPIPGMGLDLRCALSPLAEHGPFEYVLQHLNLVVAPQSEGLYTLPFP
eukprot:scaffold172_cov341-Pavlova_lutheri.AAC.34